MCMCIDTADGLRVVETRIDLKRFIEMNVSSQVADAIFSEVVPDGICDDACLCGCDVLGLETSLGMKFKAGTFDYVWSGWTDDASDRINATRKRLAR